jgi:protein tyrosine kinase modulator
VDLGFDLRYYVLLLRRRLFYILLPSSIVLAACIVVSLILPPVYRATGTIMVESQQIPDNLVRSTVTNVAGERIGFIKQRVMRRANLLRVAEKFHLFPAEDMTENSAHAVDAMNKAIIVEAMKDDVTGLPRQSGSTMAFTVSFDHANPDTALAVAKDLVALFLQENVRTRTTRAAETTAFLTQEAQKLKAQVDTIESKIARFKEDHRASLPAFQDMSMVSLERARNKLQETTQEIEAAQAERRLLTIRLAAAKSGLSITGGPIQTQGDRLTPLQELEQLQAELIEKSAVYDDAHPDIVALKRKVASLQARYGIETGKDKLQSHLHDLRAELKDIKARYAQDHPDVKRVQSEISLVEAQIAKMPRGKGNAAAGADAEAIADPIYAHVQAQIVSADDRIKLLRKQHETLRARIAELQATVDDAPMVERGLKGLNRDYQTAVRKYDEIKAKEMEAQLAQNLEADKQAERLTLLDSPVRPETPIKPNRLKIIAYGLILALGAGGAGFLFAESMDGSIRGASGYRATLKGSPYMVIPYITTAGEVQRRHQLATASLIGLGVLAVAAVIVVHLYFKPLDGLILGLFNRLA